MTEKPTDPTKDPNEETTLAVQAKLEAALAARSEAQSTQREAEGRSHPKPSDQTFEPSAPTYSAL